LISCSGKFVDGDYIEAERGFQWQPPCTEIVAMRRRLIHNLSSSTSHRKQLRKNLTSAEALLWMSLKSSQLDGKKFRRQHSIGPFIVDFYCAECRLAVELDGEGHFSLTGAEADQIRTEFLERFNVTILRFENNDVFDNLEGVLETIRIALGGAKLPS
jgi:very-short-patch-repair endonuclease